MPSRTDSPVGCERPTDLSVSHHSKYRFTMRSFARGIVVASIFTFVASLSPRARAEDWYGGQTLAFDGVGLGFLAASLATGCGGKAAYCGVGQGVFLLLSLGTYLIASPVIHGVHERGGAAVGAVGLRLGAPLALGVLGWEIGSAAEGKRFSFSRELASFAGVALGALAAAGIDAAVLARESDKPVAGGASAPSIGPTFLLPWGAAF
jgi:hypothetical protein